jgi:hypothetical protein
MIVEFQFWHLISLLLSFFGCVAGFVKFIYGQNEKRREADLERFQSELHVAREENREADSTAADITRRLEMLEVAVEAMRARMENSPSHADLGKLYEKMNAVSDKLSILIGKNEAFSETWRSFMGQLVERGFGGQK